MIATGVVKVLSNVQNCKLEKQLAPQFDPPDCGADVKKCYWHLRVEKVIVSWALSPALLIAPTLLVTCTSSGKILLAEGSVLRGVSHRPSLLKSQRKPTG
jgi:hypothetical protein